MSKFASFLVGMGGGYIKARDKEFERERQAKEDAWREEQRDWQRTERQDAANLKSDIGRAANPVTMGSVVTDAAGSNAFTKDTDAAAMLADMSSAKNVGTQTQQATRVVDTAYTDPAKAAEAALVADTPDAESKRVQDVYRKAGMRSNAMQEFTANENFKTAQEARIKMLEKEGVSAAMAALRGNDPEAAMKAFQGSGSRKLPEGSKFVQTDGTDIFTGKPGKVWSVIGPDGATIMPDVGVAAAKYLGIEGLIARDDKNRAEDAAAAALALKERQVAAVEMNAATNARKLDGLLMRGTGGGGGGGGSSSAGGMSGTLNGPALKDRRDYLSDFSGSLPDPKNALTPEEAQTISIANQKVLAQADAVFSTNAELGIILTAPQAAAAMRIASQDPASIRRVRDNNTGTVYETVVVNGKTVVLGVGSLKPAAPPAPASTAAPGSPPAATSAVTPAAAPVTPPAAAPRAPAVTTMGAMNPGGNAALNAVLGPKATQIQGMAEMLRQSQAKTAAAAKSGDPRVVMAAAQEQQQIRSLIDKTLGDMSPQQAASVRQAAGVN